MEILKNVVMVKQETNYDIDGTKFTVPFYVYECPVCGCEIPESHPHIIHDGEAFCGECAFKCGFITSEQYVRWFVPIHSTRVRAVVHDGEIHVTTGKFEWEKTPKQKRNSPKYKEWRTHVFERDGFTCQICGQVGGSLNAHHIKPFAKYPDLQYEIDNGITLCEECHKEVHRKKK